MTSAIETVQKLRGGLAQVIRGRTDTIDFVLTGLISGGHVLIEDYPGSGKTTLAKALGKLIDCTSETRDVVLSPFRRIQFTPDLLPSDVLGVNVFDSKTTSFRFQPGPIFAHVVLADEINRTGPKVQAAFLECMAERQVTVDNTTYPLDDLFFVIGTQNPLDLAGTYPLPLVQLDRFLLKIPMRYVDAETELSILQSADEIDQRLALLQPTVHRSDVLEARAASHRVTIDQRVLQSIVNIVQGTRNSPMFQFGASTRCAIMLRRALCAYALIQGREYVIEDDVKYLTPYVVQHRVRFHPGAGDPLKAFHDFLMPHLEALIRNQAL